MQYNSTNKPEQHTKLPTQDKKILDKTRQDNARQDKTIRSQNNNNATQDKTPRQDNTIAIICNKPQYWT